MAKKSINRPPQARNLSPSDLGSAIIKINRRIKELENFDVNSIEEEYDAGANALRTKINNSIADIFGRDTGEFFDYGVDSLNDLPFIVGRGSLQVSTVRRSYQKGIKDAVTKLKSLKDTLQEKLEDCNTVETETRHQSGKTLPKNRRVFVVHGHDGQSKEQVARFLEKLELEPIILHEQPNKGRTIIEKLEGHSIVDYAIVLLTPDDLGHPVDEPENVKHRARQNVIMELGLFIGSLGRNRVCALYKGELELPSDYDGVVYQRMDEGDGWKLPLAREIKEAGIEIDLNKAL